MRKLVAKKEWGQWEDVNFIGMQALAPKGLKKLYKNNIYTVQVIEKDGMTRALIRRNDETTKVSWKDKQRIKNELFGEEVTAIEVFPPQSRLVDEANIYWLWILPADSKYSFIV